MTSVPGDLVRVRLTVGGLSGDTRHVVIADELPAGMVPVNPGFLNYSLGNRSWLWGGGVEGREITQNGMVVSVGRVEGSKTVEYEARVISRGEFVIPPALASLMYAPEVWARTGVDTIVIDDNAKPVPQDDALYSMGEINEARDMTKELWLLGGMGVVVVLIIGYRVYLNRRGLKLSGLNQESSDVLAEKDDALPSSSEDRRE